MSNPVYVQNSFRIRTGDTVALNTDSGWAALENINATIDAGQVFRIRFHISETAGKGSSQGFKIQANIGGAGWNTIEPDGGTATYSAVNKPSSQFSDAAATSTELLTNQGASYVNGQGDWDNSATANPDGSETELEFALMIMQWYDGPAKVADANTIQFRVVEADDTAFTTYSQTPTVTVNMPTSYIGGTMVESPNHLGPIADSNGNIYTIIEPSETDPKMMMIKSTDGGDTWAEMDGAGRPVQEDLECVDIKQVDDVLHILCHDGGAVYYHTFQTSDHASADQWGTIDNAVITGISLGTGQQACALGVHSSGDKIAIYNKLSTSDRLFFKVDTGGGWGSEQNLEVTTGYNWHWATGIFDANGVFHVFYSGDDGANGEIYHVDITEISTVWTLGSRESIDLAAGDGNDYDADIVPPVTWGSGASADVMMAYIDPDDDKLYSVVVTNNGSPGTRKALSDNAVAYNAADADMPGNTNSRQPVADLSVNGTDVYCHFADGTTLDLYRDTAADDGGWTTDVEELDGKTVHWVRSHSFTHSSGNGGATVVGYIYDNGSDGGTGHIWYNELFLAHAPNISDDATISESVTVSVGAAPPTDPEPNVTDNAEISEAITAEVSAPQVSVTDNAELSDSATVSVGDVTALEPSITDNAEISESIAVTVSDLAISVQDDVTAQDYLWFYESGITASDSATVEPEIVFPQPNITDNAEVSESVTATISAPQVDIQDDATIADAVTVEPQEATPRSISAQDDATIAESVSATVSAPRVSITDNAEVSDSAALEVDDPLVSVQDDATISDSVTVSVGSAGETSIGAQDDATIVDSVTVAVSAPQVAAQDDATITDSATVSIAAAGETNVSAQDDATIADSVSATVSDPPVSVQDDAIITDSVTLSISSAGDLTVSVQDDVTLTDTVTMVGSDLVLVASDDATISDSATADIQLEIAVQDDATVTDSVTLEQQFYISAADNLTAADSVMVVLPDPLAIGITDNATISESVTASIPILALLDVELTDSAVYTVTLSDSAQYGVTLSDAAVYEVALSDVSRSSP